MGGGELPSLGEAVVAVELLPGVDGLLSFGVEGVLGVVGLLSPGLLGEFSPGVTLGVEGFSVVVVTGVYLPGVVLGVLAVELFSCPGVEGVEQSGVSGVGGKMQPQAELHCSQSTSKFCGPQYA